eukprot:6174873-Pleurochrysis_carterae.AAC.2
MGRGAILAGAEVVDFDIARRSSTYGLKAVPRIRGGYERKPLQQMKYVQGDVMDDQFWSEMNNLGRINGYILHQTSSTLVHRATSAQLKNPWVCTRPMVHRPHKCYLTNCIIWSNIDAGECSWTECIWPGL